MAHRIIGIDRREIRATSDRARVAMTIAEVIESENMMMNTNRSITTARLSEEALRLHRLHLFSKMIINRVMSTLRIVWVGVFFIEIKLRLYP